ncbi:hypothetical protein GOL30_19700 [Sinorhizobium medicae]|uniref:Uncharacterized protein n=2 Tax=Sinorhizobium medicae TaxID=110321 RepID=A0A508WP90_9HYPH|nr:hypothetical protein Smed_0912 [Sinorhizobium medicae WSM419]MDX0407352.1 hypothetical protein [Sinorhizobium medicae]MDX0413596.1 hypothetical protein [Sinorhizobium medicae]MDX0419282.1 hypothetical protein [Sinorhizobium medicae]MDX0424668.1 hypothetical protein [Sinorhizobium medicae]
MTRQDLRGFPQKWSCSVRNENLSSAQQAATLVASQRRRAGLRAASDQGGNIND